LTVSEKSVAGAAKGTLGDWWSPRAEGAEALIAVRTTVQNGVQVVAFDGDLDARTAPPAHRRATGTLIPDCPVVLDLSRVKYVSSAGLRMLLLLHRDARRIARVPMVLTGVSHELRSVLEATGFLRFLAVHPKVDDGIRAALAARHGAGVPTAPTPATGG
jgi:anti-sigma B factor antagonist